MSGHDSLLWTTWSPVQSQGSIGQDGDDGAETRGSRDASDRKKKKKKENSYAASSRQIAISRIRWGLSSSFALTRSAFERIDRRREYTAIQPRLRLNRD